MLSQSRSGVSAGSLPHFGPMPRFLRGVSCNFVILVGFITDLASEMRFIPSFLIGALHVDNPFRPLECYGLPAGAFWVSYDAEEPPWPT